VTWEPEPDELARRPAEDPVALRAEIAARLDAVRAARDREPVP
jgi:hypothetical protein